MARGAHAAGIGSHRGLPDQPALSAWRLLRGDTRRDALATLRTGVMLAAVLIPMQIAVGDFHGLNTLEHQPAKIAAMEGVWQTERGAPLLLFAVAG